MLVRRVEPEILDSLPAEDPTGRRSRRDLRMINTLMGNHRWIVRSVGRWEGAGPVTELGAGEGCLLKVLAQQGMTATGIDLAPRPADLPGEVGWVQGDLFDQLRGVQGAVVASLVLHHFEDEALARLGEILRKAELLCFAEPLRSPVALAEGYALFPLVNPVTRHDMIVSIRAGFIPGELPRLLGLDESWRVHEEATLLGGYRMRAQKQ